MTSASGPLPSPGRQLQRLLGWISDLRLAIGLLLVIAVASAVGTAIPQKELADFYHQRYDSHPWLGLLRADGLLRLQLDHVYSSSWFLALLAWLALSLLLCSWRRQWPALRSSLGWIDYRDPRQLSKLSVAETRASGEPSRQLAKLAAELDAGGWQVRRQPGRLAARRGVVGRVGPLLVHAGLVLLMLGAAWGALAGQRLERFLPTGQELELIDRRGNPQITLALDDFAIQRDPAGRPEQFTSRLRLVSPGGGQDAAAQAAAAPGVPAEVSVNHPLRFRGLTVYQADWALAALRMRLGSSPVLEVPLQSFPQLGEQIWGVVLPTRPDGSEPVLLVLGSEQGPVEAYGPGGELLGRLLPGGPAEEVRGLPIKVESILPASGLLLKRDPGVPLVYAGFAVALLGGGLSLVATRQLWAIAEPGRLHVGGLCNRNLTGFAAELPAMLEAIGGVEGTPEAQQG